MKAAKKAGVHRFGFVSVHQTKYLHKFGPLHGYFNGKRRAENTLTELYNSQGTIVKPMMVNGTRYEGNLAIPLYAIGTPLNAITTLSVVQNTIAKLPILNDLLVPPINASVVGRALISSMLSKEKREGVHVITVDDMLKL